MIEYFYQIFLEKKLILNLTIKNKDKKRGKKQSEENNKAILIETSEFVKYYAILRKRVTIGKRDRCVLQAKLCFSNTYIHPCSYASKCTHNRKLCEQPMELFIMPDIHRIKSLGQIDNNFIDRYLSKLVPCSPSFSFSFFYLYFFFFTFFVILR